VPLSNRSCAATVNVPVVSRVAKLGKNGSKPQNATINKIGSSWQLFVQVSDLESPDPEAEALSMRPEVQLLKLQNESLSAIGQPKYLTSS
jgi:hypothetical protein